MKSGRAQLTRAWITMTTVMSRAGGVVLVTGTAKIFIYLFGFSHFQNFILSALPLNLFMLILLPFHAYTFLINSVHFISIFICDWEKSTGVNYVVVCIQINIVPCLWDF